VSGAAEEAAAHCPLANFLTEPVCVCKLEILEVLFKPGLPMSDTAENLILDLLELLGRRERTYHETMDA